MRLGVHVKTLGNMAGVAERAAAMGCETIQIFSGNPRSWNKGVFDERAARRMLAALDERGICPLFVHASYLPNLASSDDVLFERSIRLVSEELVRTERLSAAGLVLHGGSSRGLEGSPSERLAAGIRASYSRASVLAPLLVENGSGGGSTFGSSMRELAELFELLEGLPVGLALDTAHAWAAGYDIAGGEGWRRLLSEIESSMGIRRLRLIHGNDSRAELGSHVDRHWHTGKGAIGEEGFEAMGRIPQLAELPVILEVPGVDDAADREDLETMKRLVGRRG